MYKIIFIGPITKSYVDLRGASIETVNMLVNSPTQYDTWVYVNTY